jgi:glyoxylase-like metal-dependent hydrolase (beta-lactamase superfamily II)
MLKAAIIPVTPFAQNCSLVWCDETLRGAVVDPGGDLDRVLGVVAKQGVTLEKILVTHGHLDHAGAVADLGDRLALPVEGPHRDDAFWIERLPESGRQFGFPPLRSFEPGRWLEQGDTVSVGKLAFEVLHCPGHTPGHVVFVNQAARFVIVGDVLFSGSVGRTDFPYGDHAALIHAIKSKLLPLGDDLSFICGHGPGSTIGAERRANPFVRG